MEIKALKWTLYQDDIHPEVKLLRKFFGIKILQGKT